MMCLTLGTVVTTMRVTMKADARVTPPPKKSWGSSPQWPPQPLDETPAPPPPRRGNVAAAQISPAKIILPSPRQPTEYTTAEALVMAIWVFFLRPPTATGAATWSTTAFSRYSTFVEEEAPIATVPKVESLRTLVRAFGPG